MPHCILTLCECMFTVIFRQHCQVAAVESLQGHSEPCMACYSDGPNSTSVHVLQDLPRTFPLNAWVGSAEGQGALRNVLLAFSVHKPDVGYCQSMNYVAAMLLLCLDLSEERAFWVMVALIDDNGQCCPCNHRFMFASTMSCCFCGAALAHKRAWLVSSSFSSLVPNHMHSLGQLLICQLDLAFIHLSSHLLPSQGQWGWFGTTESNVVGYYV